MCVNVFICRIWVCNETFLFRLWGPSRVCVCLTFSLHFQGLGWLEVYPRSVKQSSHLHKHQSMHLTEHYTQTQINTMMILNSKWMWRHRYTDHCVTSFYLFHIQRRQVSYSRLTRFISEQLKVLGRRNKAKMTSDCIYIQFSVKVN